MRAEINKMRTTTILLMVLTMSVFIIGCSKTQNAQIQNINQDTQTVQNAQTSADAEIIADMTTDTPSENPDIGTLDNITVSEELPQ
jgi:PBP1b-binding outer membrane lipoprotein LpoB